MGDPASPHRKLRTTLVKGVCISILERIAEASRENGVPSKVVQSDDDGRVIRALEANFHHRVDTGFPRKNFMQGENLLPRGSALVNDENNIGYERPLSLICREKIMALRGGSGPVHLPIIATPRTTTVSRELEVGRRFYSLII